MKSHIGGVRFQESSVLFGFLKPVSSQLGLLLPLLDTKGHMLFGAPNPTLPLQILSEKVGLGWVPGGSSHTF